MASAPPRPTPPHSAPPQFELRCGGLHVTVQRVPVWLVPLVTTAGGIGAAWWAR
ncbi:hypothetical protein AB0N81_17200 [Streptomyces sp. NPDC093510]|uniref:hypothetical protein n=1 Tax=Streptomyces sp. NPDC093510 TaxID=3155199 RepID=UPI00342D2EBA